MISLVLLVCILIVLGFVLAWITGVVAHEELSVMHATIILVINAVVNMVAGALLSNIVTNETLLGLVNIPLSLVILGGLLWLMASIPFKKAVIIAAVFAVLMWLVGIVLALVAS